MALTKVRTGGITADAVDNTILDLADDFAFTGTITGAGEVNEPYFFARKTSDQTITRNTYTVVTEFTSDEIDTDNAFNGSRFTVPTGKGGKYYFHGNICSDYSAIGGDGEQSIIKFNVDGSGSGIPEHTIFKTSGYNLNQFSNAYSVILDLNAGQYVELLVYNKDGNASGSAKIINKSHFMGFKL